MKKISKIFTFSIMTMALLLVTSCSDDDNGPTIPPEQPMDPLNIVETALGENSLSTLVAALQKADESAANDLVAALSDENGTFTVLAPNNDALQTYLPVWTDLIRWMILTVNNFKTYWPQYLRIMSFPELR
ncbi:fasciclin domain-containing protein [Ulvibacterium marinum]|uniref:fasciclin domain-containing protein n=1 Tax=Ulvibacterium marinum TaxID=2419782 RepID=UPI0024955585|nr:fasciclin domain-containing protein [Ulvibacterium marinum]